jgi:hypothetical protein
MNQTITWQPPRIFWGLSKLSDEQVKKWISIFEHNLAVCQSNDQDYYHTITTAISELKTENSKRFEQQYGQKTNLLSRAIQTNGINKS